MDREREVEAVGELLLRDGVRLVTLTGPGGVGKSRLALKVGAGLGASFEDGVRFVELASVTAPELVATTLATALGLRVSGGRSPVEVVKSYLRDRQLLLVLDNFEQVAEAAPLVAELLAAAPGVEALVTSRTVLRLSGEYGFAVPPLSVPETGAGREIGSLEQYGAVRLFVERARAAKPGFELTGENAEAVAEICRRLDGLPLAIELAAARVRLLPPRALLARLGSRLGLLTGGARDLPERQRTLRSTLAWSYGMLGEDEQMVFARSGVFVGGFELQAAEAVCGLANDPSENRDRVPDVVEALGSLVDQSLVWQEERNGELRFRMLETIREYALERLRETPYWREAHDRHAAYYLALAEAAEPELRGPGQLQWVERLQTENNNLRAAMSWFVEQDQIEQAVRLGWGLLLFWWFHGHVEEGGRWMEEILTKSGSLPPYLLARALSGAGVMAFARADYARAQTLLEQSLPLHREAGDKRGIGAALEIPGFMATLRGEYGRAREMLEESLDLYRELGDDWNVALGLNNLGWMPLRQGDPDRAARLFEEGLSVARRVGDRLPISVSLNNLALSRQAQDDLTGAAELLEEELALLAEAGDDAQVAYSLQRLAALAGLQEDAERAAHLYGAAQRLLEAAGGVPFYDYSLDRSGHERAVERVRSRMEKAAFEEAWAEGRAMGRGRAVAYALRREA